MLGVSLWTIQRGEERGERTLFSSLVAALTNYRPADGVELAQEQPRVDGAGALEQNASHPLS